MFEGQGKPRHAASGVDRRSVTVAALMAMAGRALGVGRVNNDGTFELRGLAGPQMIRVQGLPAGWAVKSISLDGTDVTDAPFDFRPGASHRPRRHADRPRDRHLGRRRRSRGQPVTDYVLVVFPETEALGRAVPSCHDHAPESKRRLQHQGLPPARYLAAVVPSLENGMQNDVTLLAQLRPRARASRSPKGRR